MGEPSIPKPCPGWHRWHRPLWQDRRGFGFLLLAGLCLRFQLGLHFAKLVDSRPQGGCCFVTRIIEIYTNYNEALFNSCMSHTCSA